MAVVAETKYKTKACCLLYNNPVVMVTRTGTGNQAVFYKPTTTVLPKKDDADTGKFNTRSTVDQLKRTSQKNRKINNIRSRGQLYSSVADPGFPRGGCANCKGGGGNLLFLPISPKTA